MIYRGYTTEIPLPNSGLGLYAAPSFIVLPNRATIRRSASARLDQLPRRYYGADPPPQGLAYTSYQTFDYTGASWEFHNPWEATPSTHSEGSWQQGSSSQWQQGPYGHYYQGSADMQEESSGGVHYHPDRASYSGPSYHEYQQDRQELHAQLDRIEESQAALMQAQDHI